jgi:hypothetical protein
MDRGEEIQMTIPYQKTDYNWLLGIKQLELDHQL